MKINIWVVMHLAAAVYAKMIYAQHPSLLLGALCGGNVWAAFCSFMHDEIVQQYAKQYFDEVEKEKQEK